MDNNRRNMNLGDVANSNPVVFSMLTDAGYSHTEVANYITEHGFSTSEASVRRWRRANIDKLIEPPKPEFVIPDTVEDMFDEQNLAARVEELEERNKQLRKANHNLTGKIADTKISKQDMVDAVYDAVSDAMSGLDIQPVPAPKYRVGKGDGEHAVALVSDLQLAKVTPTYTSEICEQRMEEYAQKIIKLAEIQRTDHPVDEITVTCLGDIVEGVEIFPGQQWLIDAGLYRQVTVDGPRIMINFFRTLLGAFKKVHVVWVIGNHGRIGRKGTFDPETNADRMLGNIIQMLLENEPRIDFVVPDGRGERNWYAVAEVGNYKALCIHGDQIRGHSGFPWYGLGKKVQGWAAGAIPEDFQDVFMGHFHQVARVPLNNRTVWANGSTESYNTYAQENLAAMSDPQQWLLFVDPEKGKVTASYVVDLT